MTPMEFTGERYVPGQGGSQIAYEHWHRYLYALRWARNRDVVDVAAGTGYGAGLLASVARRVWALDWDTETTAYAYAKYASRNLMFVRADALDLPLSSQSVDLVVALEILEHLKKAEKLISETARVLRHGGVVLVSTPNRASYSDDRNYSNPFHVREFYQEEFRELLQRYFKHVKIVHQRMRAGSMISTESGPPTASDEIFACPLPDCTSESLAGMYFLGICSDEEAQTNCPARSAYLDLTDMLFQEADLRLNQSMAGFHKLKRKASGLVGEKEALEKQVEELKGHLLSREQELLRMRDEFTEQLDQRERTIQNLQRQITGQ